MPDRGLIEECLECKRVAVIGVSRTPTHFSRTLFRELLRRGYDAVPVNPGAGEIEGRRCWPSVAEVSPAVEWALVMTGPKSAPDAVRECAGAGIHRIWLYRAAGKGAATDEALRACDQEGLAAASGCPFMFFPGTGFPHKFHALVLKIVGKYPA
jgi:predicted CoA-binding protein